VGLAYDLSDHLQKIVEERKGTSKKRWQETIAHSHYWRIMLALISGIVGYKANSGEKVV